MENHSPEVQKSCLPDAQWLTTPRFALMLGLLVFAAFPQVVIGTHSFAYRDFGLFGYPLAHYFRDSFWRGELPLWNPYNEFGTPFLAQWGTMVLYPPSLIYLLLPLPWSLSFFCLLHLFFGGIGMYVLTSKWTNSQLAGGVAGTAFAFSGLVLNCLMWPNYTASLAWMPWVVYAVSAAWDLGGRRIIWASLAGALQMLSGTPEVVLFTWLILAGLWLCTSLKTWGHAWVSVRRIFVVILLVTALSAAQLLPFFELLAHSQRDANFEKGQWPVPPWGWANLFVPMFRLYGTGCGVHFQYNQMFTSSIYSGIFVMLLALLALLWFRDRRVWFFVCVAVGSLVLSMGEHASVYPWLRQGFPQLGFMRYTSKFAIPMAFAWPLVGAFGLAGLLRLRERESILWRLRMMTAVGAGIVVLIGGIVMFARYTPFPAEDWSKTFSNGATRIGLLMATGAALFFAVRMQASNRQWLFHCLILLLVWLDYMSHVPQQNPTLDREGLTLRIPQIEQLAPRPRLGESRAALTIFARHSFSKAGTSNLTQTFLCLRNGLFANANLVEKIPKVDGFYALSIKAAREVEYRLFQTDHEPRAGLARFVGISQLTSATNPMVWEPRPGYMPMVTAGQQPIFANRSNALAGLRATNFSPETVVFLPDSASGQITATNQGSARVISLRVREHRIEAQVEAIAPAMVVIAQAFYPPWRAFVDGEPVKLWRANHGFQALEIGPGTHCVELVYKDRPFMLGACIAGAAWCGLAVAGRCTSRKCTAAALVRDTVHDGTQIPAHAKTPENTGDSAGPVAVA